jgi:hypothetical protein
MEYGWQGIRARMPDGYMNQDICCLFVWGEKENKRLSELT